MSIADQRVDVDIFDGLTVSLVLPVHAAATRGLSYMDPVGRPVAGSAKAMSIDQGFEQQRMMAIPGVQVMQHGPGAQSQDLVDGIMANDTGVFDASTDGTWQEWTQFRNIAERSAGKRSLPTHSLSENQFQPKLNLAGTRGRAGDFGR